MDPLFSELSISRRKVARRVQTRRRPKQIREHSNGQRLRALRTSRSGHFIAQAQLLPTREANDPSKCNQQHPESGRLRKDVATERGEKIGINSGHDGTPRRNPGSKLRRASGASTSFLASTSTFRPSESDVF